MDIFQIVRHKEFGSYVDNINGIDVNIRDVDGQSLLHEAVAYGSNLIGHDLLKREIDLNHQDNNGQTALHYAAVHGNFILAKDIVEFGGDPNIKDKYGNNALWTAVFNAKGKYDIVELYVEAGGIADSKNKSNRSPLDFAMQIKDDRLVDILTVNGSSREPVPGSR